MRQDPSQVERVRLAVSRGPEGAPRALAKCTVFVSDTPPRSTGNAPPGGRLSANLTVAAGRGDEQGQDDRRRDADGSRVPVVFTGRGGHDRVVGYMAEALLLAVDFVYLILAAQFESFIETVLDHAVASPVHCGDGGDAAADGDT